MLLVLFRVIATGNDQYSRTDAFEYARGLEIIESSRVFPGFSINDMFGAEDSSGTAASQTIFDDRTPENDIDYVEFRTPEEVPLIGFTFVASADGAYLRGSLEVTLKIDADDDGVFEVIQGPFTLAPVAQDLLLPFTTNFNQVVAGHFRFEIKRYPQTPDLDDPVDPPVDPWLGPRVVELDAITATNADRPIVSLDLSGGSDFKEPATVTLTATATDGDGIRRVDFYDHELKVGTKTSAPYSLTLSNLKGGSHRFRAKAVDALGAAEWSNEIPVDVGFPPFSIKDPHFIEADRFSFTLQQLAIGQTYSVEASNNLKDWTSIDSVYASESTVEWYQAELEQNPSVYRFFRIRMVPSE